MSLVDTTTFVRPSGSDAPPVRRLQHPSCQLPMPFWSVIAVPAISVLDVLPGVEEVDVEVEGVQEQD